MILNLNCFYSIFAKKRNSQDHFKYAKKHKIIPRNCCFSIITLCSPQKLLFLLNSNKPSTVISHERLCMGCRRWVTVGAHGFKRGTIETKYGNGKMKKWVGILVSTRCSWLTSADYNYSPCLYQMILTIKFVRNFSFSGLTFWNEARSQYPTKFNKLWKIPVNFIGKNL
jgi:hypothetical protein